MIRWFLWLRRTWNEGSYHKGWVQGYEAGYNTSQQEKYLWE